MEEISPMMRPALPGMSLIIGGGQSAAREAQKQMSSATSSRDVLMVQAGSTDSGVGGTGNGLRQSVSILAIAPTSAQLPSETAGATVFVGAGGTAAPAKSIADSPSTWRRTSVPEVQTVNGYETKQAQQQLQSPSVLPQHHQQQHPQNPTSSPQHVVKIRINPEDDTGRVISTVRLTGDQEDPGCLSGLGRHSSSARLVLDTTGSPNDNDPSTDDGLRIRQENAEIVTERNIANKRASAAESCVRISVVNGSDEVIDNNQQSNNLGQSLTSPKNSPQRDEMVQQRGSTDSVNATSLNRASACFYYGSFQNNQLGTMVMSSGQCSPSDTLDSGTCSDLDGTPPPLPKKKNSSTVLLGVSGNSGNSRVATGAGQHQRTGSLTSSGAEVDSDDNESNISCDSLNSGELAARVADQQNVQVNGVAHGVAVLNEGSLPECQIIQKDSDTLKITNDKIVIIANDKNVEHLTSELESVNIRNNNNHSNNNNENGNNNNNNNNNKTEDAMNANAKISGEEEMNERNNGNGNVAMVSTPEVISSSSSSTRGTSPSVSPSPSGASSLSKASSTPRVRSPVAALPNGRVASPVVKECTYEERQREQDRLEEESAAADYYANYNRKNGTKYLYDDDRFYKFHINENQPNANDDENKNSGDQELDEFFAGCKILDREAIRSAKGTVRGVKNRVRAGIATFLQKPSSKNYKTMDEGKIVVYLTSMGIVRETFFACIKMLQILKTHMVKFEVRDMYMSRELQDELRDRLGCETVDVPQLFIDGEYIGNGDEVERLNESGELRRMFQPYKSPGACATCVICGGCRLLPCSVCNGSKKSPVGCTFMRGFYGLRCMKCDEAGLVRCPLC